MIRYRAWILAQSVGDRETSISRWIDEDVWSANCVRLTFLVPVLSINSILKVGVWAADHIVANDRDVGHRLGWKFG